MFFFVVIILIVWGFGAFCILIARAGRAGHQRNLQVSEERAEENARNAQYRRDVERMLDPAKANEWTSHPKGRDPAG